MQDVEKLTHYGNDDNEQGPIVRGWLPTYSLGFVGWWQSCYLATITLGEKLKLSP
jgi:hypothetical protein